MMETQKYLFEHSAELPEGLYLELMNKLKIDYDNPVAPVVQTVVKTVYLSISKWVPKNRADFLQMIIDKTVDYPNRDEILKRTVTMQVYQLRRYCQTNSWDVTKLNPKWVQT
jgi:hypothetical protein